MNTEKKYRALVVDDDRTSRSLACEYATVAPAEGGGSKRIRARSA
ncbi:MAG: hypothetical protein OEY94_09700 [Alphaproteobacteria bacterium]|nr:hypothetical protein [Alphaproteobacteria bacterium]